MDREPASEEDRKGPLSPRVVRSEDESLSTPAILRLVEVSVEVESVPAAMDWCLDALLERPGGFSDLADLLDRTPRMNRTARHLWAEIGARSVLHRLVGVETDAELEDGNDDGSVRSDGPRFTSEYGLIRSLEDVVAEHEEALDPPPIRHPEPVVRKAAVRHGASRSGRRTSVLRAALRDEAACVRSAALQTRELTRCPELVSDVARLATDEEQPADLRETAVNALADMDAPEAFEALLDLAVDRGWIGRWFRWPWELRENAPLLLPALRALLFGRWRDRDELRRVTELGRQSPNPRVRALAENRVRERESEGP